MKADGRTSTVGHYAMPQLWKDSTFGIFMNAKKFRHRPLMGGSMWFSHFSGLVIVYHGEKD